MADDHRQDVLKAAERAGFPRVEIRPAEAVMAGRENWEKFTAVGSAEDVRRAREGLEADGRT